MNKNNSCRGSCGAWHGINSFWYGTIMLTLEREIEKSCVGSSKKIETWVSKVSPTILKSSTSFERFKINWSFDDLDNKLFWVSLIDEVCIRVRRHFCNIVEIGSKLNSIDKGNKGSKARKVLELNWLEVSSNLALEFLRIILNTKF